MNEIIAFLFSFRFFHFLFVIGVVSYLIKTKLTPVIDQEMLQQEKTQEQLRNSLEQLKKETTDTIASIEHQRLHAQNLLDRIATWNGAIQKLNEQDKALQIRSQEALNAFTKQQEYALLIESLKKDMAPSVMQQVRDILELKFKDSAAQEKFLDRSLTAMEASKQ